MSNGDMLQAAHVGNSIAKMKNGSQQQTNAPVMIANVLAAFRSRFESADIWAFFRVIVDLMTGVVFDGYAIDIVSLVGPSFSIPLP